MQCTNPRNVGFKEDGTSLAWSYKDHSKEYSTFQLPCGKCISCRLKYAQEVAIRCCHEAQMYEKNSFITLTYSDENLKSPKLIYSDFQKFIKRLRKSVYPETISLLVTGEYGPETKRPHWHAIIFNYAPNDAVFYRKNNNGDLIYKSESLDKIWGMNDPKQRPNEIGAVTMQSASYVARYSLKKLSHGYDKTHEYEPISRRSSKHAIGKKWLEKYYLDIFNHGYVVTPDGGKASIPRYYHKWLLANHPGEYRKFVSGPKLQKMIEIRKKENDYVSLEKLINQEFGTQLTRNQMRAKIMQQKLKQQQAYTNKL